MRGKMGSEKLRKLDRRRHEMGHRREAVAGSGGAMKDPYDLG